MRPCQLSPTLPTPCRPPSQRRPSFPLDHRACIAVTVACAVAVAADPVLAATLDQGPPRLSVPDTAWMLMASTLVLAMTVPGLALFYGGLVRAKNATSTAAQVFAVFCAVSVLWFACGYSIVYTSSSWVGYFGGFDKALLLSVRLGSLTPTHALGLAIPEYLHFAFQMTIAGLTPALIIGAFAERMRFQACVLFAVLWSLTVYLPIAHMTWFVPSPDVIADAARAVAQAAPGAARRQAGLALAAAQGDAGLFAQWGALDFAGGLVVHTSAGIAGLIGALVIGRRQDYGRATMAPHNLMMMMIGGALLWVGWLGFNAGSALGANATAALAIVNSLLAAIAGAGAWMAVEVSADRKPTLIGVVSGMLAGLVAITAAAGYAAPAGALVLGGVAGAASYWACTYFKATYAYDDSLDVFGIHCVGGVLGVLAAGVLASPDLGGTGVVNFALRPGEAVVGAFDILEQLRAQCGALLVVLAWSAYVSYRLFKLVDYLVGLRPSAEEEARGLDIVDHGERAYNI